MKYIDGLSSFLFIISTIKTIYSSRLLLYRFGNISLIYSSFLVNSYQNNSLFLLIDYSVIYLICLSYINHLFIQIFLNTSLLYEYHTKNTIETTKNICFIVSISKGIYNTYIFIEDKSYYYTILTSTLVGLTLYSCRYKKMFDPKHNTFVTFLWHICIMNILYISSITSGL